MKKFKCKNGCSGKEGFSFEGNVWVSGSVDVDGRPSVDDRAPFVEVIYYCCNECDGEWNVEKEEEFHI